MNKVISICYNNIIHVLNNYTIEEFIKEKKIQQSDIVLSNESLKKTIKKTGIKTLYFYKNYNKKYIIPEEIETIININGQDINNLPLSVHTIYITSDTIFIHPIKSHIKHIIFNTTSNQWYCDSNCDTNKLIFEENSKLESIEFGSGYNHPIDDLPNTIKKLCLGSRFNQIINKLPESLEELLFNDTSCSSHQRNFEYNMDLNDALEKCINLKNLCLPQKYNQPLNKLPESLKKLTLLTKIFNPVYDNDIILPPYLEEFNCENIFFNRNINFPNTLQILKGGTFNILNSDCFDNTNLKILKIKILENCVLNNLPVTLEVLQINNSFNSNINLINLINLKELYIDNFNNYYTLKNENSLNLSSLTNLKKLYVKFLNCIDVMNLPTSLEDLECNLIHSESCPIKFPDSIKKLKISISEKHNFIFPSNIQKLKIDINFLYNRYNKQIIFLSLLNLSNTLKELDLSTCSGGIISFDKLVPEEKGIPDSLEILKLNDEYNTEINQFPTNLKEIYFGSSFNKSIKEISNCLMLKKVNFGNDFDKTIKYLPDSVEEINLGSFFKQKINKIPTNLKKIYFRKKHVNYYDFINKYPQINIKTDYW
jgi:hypothetical protein